jgi:hypothetical protein
METGKQRVRALLSGSCKRHILVVCQHIRVATELDNRVFTFPYDGQGFQTGIPSNPQKRTEIEPLIRYASVGQPRPTDRTKLSYRVGQHSPQNKNNRDNTYNYENPKSKPLKDYLPPIEQRYGKV